MSTSETTQASSGANRTLVVGAGPAGLAVAACLARAGVHCLVLEQGDGVGASWRNHYDRLHLNTNKGLSALPFAPFPRHYPRYPSRRQMIAYLEEYARRFAIEPKFGAEVIAARRAGGAWRVDTVDGVYWGSHLVIAAGCTREPNRPQWPGQESYAGPVLHSSGYRSGAPFAGRRVLVVGLGNSGGEIAMDLHEHGAKPCLSVRRPVNVIPRELFGIPILAIAIAQGRLPPGLADAISGPILRAVFGDLGQHGLERPAQGPMTEMVRHNRVPLIDAGTIELVKRGLIPVYPEVREFTGDGIVFSDGRRARFDAVILATGYRPRVDSFLRGCPTALERHGTPVASGPRSPVPGLFFCGYRIAPTGILREVGREARLIAAAIARERSAAGGR